MKQQAQPPGAAIRTIRVLAGLTQEDVATGADTSVSYLSKVETGVFTPTRTYVARVVEYIAESMLKEAA